MDREPHGALIDSGAEDWQIFQRASDGTGEIRLQGRWQNPERGEVQVRLVHQDTGVAVAAPLDWHRADTRDDGRWSARLAKIPAGGLYRLETRFRPDSVVDAEWSKRGDMRHFLGVGDLWVIAGQSNSAGYGRGPYHDAPELGVHLFRNSETWALATHPMNESTRTRHLCNTEDANPAHSPYLHVGRRLRQALGVPIGLVQTALGGSPLSRWNPAETSAADLFENMIHCIEAAGGRVTGIFWHQGESDTGSDEVAATYAERFVAAVRAWRRRLNDASLPVLTVQINRVYNTIDPAADRRWSLVREAQRCAPARLARVAVVPSLDLPLCDLVHTGPPGNMVLGERLAQAALGLVYGRPENYAAPDLRAARRTTDGLQIELRFGPVASRINSVNQLANPFRVEDSGGGVPIRQVVYPKDETLRLVLSRPLTGPAVVHGGYGQDPECMPVDMERNLPILAFHGVRVE